VEAQAWAFAIGARLVGGAVDTRRVSPAVEAPDGSAVELLLRFTRAGHEAGYPTADLEERVLALARAVGLEEPQISVTPTVIDLTVGSMRAQRSYTLRVRPGTVDLDRLARLDDLVRDVRERRLGIEGALASLETMRDEPLWRPWPLLLAAYALAGAALTPVLGGGWREAVAAALVGLCVGVVAVATRHVVRAEPIAAPIAAVAASFTATALSRAGIDASPDLVTLAALVTFLPGMTLTIGMRELASEHLQSGVANTASALVQLLGLVFGVQIGRSIALNWFGPVVQIAPDPAFSSWHLLAAAAAGLAFTLTLRARYTDAYLMCASTVIALVANEAGAALFGKQAAAFVAAFAIGVVGNLAAARLRRSALVFIVPGVLMLVPGSAGYNSVLQLVTDQQITGITAGFDTFVTAISIAYGLMVSTVVLPRRFTQVFD
jgi:uncharacterized membrane protein YjjP (DUF1212 family)